VSRILGTQLIGRWESRRRQKLLDQLLDGEDLRAWWRSSAITPIDVPHLNHEDARSAIASLQPAIMVRVSGGLLKRETFSLASLATLNIHHGRTPHIRGMWSIPWGIIEGRREWIGATLHVIDDGIDTGRILWRGAPQLAPGDTGTTLFFRAHCEAVDALVGVIRDCMDGVPSTHWPSEDAGPSVYRSAPGVRAWLRYLYSGGGARAAVLMERTVKP
jgi:methionyl-tRNA formyltransferase